MWPDVLPPPAIADQPDVAAQFGGPSAAATCRSTTWESVRAYYDVLLRLEPPYQPVARAHSAGTIHYGQRPTR